MRARFAFWLGLTTTVAAALVGASCSSSDDGISGLPPLRDAAAKDDAKGGIEGGTKPPLPDGGGGNGRVFAHTQDTLYLYEPLTNTLTLIGPFSGLSPGERVLDIAVDRTGAMFATTDSGADGPRFLSVDPTNAGCTKISALTIGDYPNSLSFVPAGTVDQNKEALVGYAYNLTDRFATDYVRIDVGTGAISTLGDLNAGGGAIKYQSSGDLISLIQDDKRAYLTIRDTDPDAGAVTDQLAEIDPATGAIKRVIGDTKQARIFGLGYWAGKGYGFADDGNAVEIDMGTGAGKVVKTLEDAGAAIPWFGAGVTTDAPGPR
jgi:hypothetical protein